MNLNARKYRVENSSWFMSWVRNMQYACVFNVYCIWCECAENKENKIIVNTATTNQFHLKTV